MKNYINKYKFDIKFNKFIITKNLVNIIYNSARLEGIKITLPQTMTILSGVSVGGMKMSDLMVVVNLKRTWEFVFENLDYNPLQDLNYVRKINSLIGDNDVIYGAGMIRQGGVKIKGSTYKPEIPNEKQIEKELQSIDNSSLSNTSKAIYSMLYLARTQAFIDGNKRTSMMIANQILIKNGCGILTIDEDKQLEFFDKLVAFYESNEYFKIDDFLYEKCISDFRMSKEIYE